jgi:hypothetical protein
MTDNDRADADEESDRPTIELTPEHELDAQDPYEPPSDEELAETFDRMLSTYPEEIQEEARRWISSPTNDSKAEQVDEDDGGESTEPSDDETESEGTHQQTLIPETDNRGIDHVAGSVTRFHLVEEGESRVVASGALLPDGTVAATPRHPVTGDPLEGQTGTWPSLDHYRVSAIGRGQSISVAESFIPKVEMLGEHIWVFGNRTEVSTT